MRPLQELPISAAPASSPAGHAEVLAACRDLAGGAATGGRPGSGRLAPAHAVAVPSPARRVRCVIGVIAGVLWWGGLLCYVLGPGVPAASWQGWVAAGGWGLGLIPLHAVPAHACRPRRHGARGRGADLAA